MTRQGLIEKLCSLILEHNDKSDYQSFLREILTRVTTNQLSVEDAEVEMNSLIKHSERKFADQVKSRGLRSSIHYFLSDNLSQVESLKMISSMITHCIIEYEQTNDSDQLNKLHIYELLDILERSLVTQSINNDDLSRIKEILIEYGY